MAEDARGVVPTEAGEVDDAALSERALVNGTLVLVEALVDGLVCRVADGSCAADGVGSGAGVTTAGAASGGGASGVA